jgi:hypothetical protein
LIEIGSNLEVHDDHEMGKNSQASVIWKGIDRTRQEKPSQDGWTMSSKGAQHELCTAETAQNNNRPYGTKDTLRVKGTKDITGNAREITDYARALAPKKTRNQLVVCTPRHQLISHTPTSIPKWNATTAAPIDAATVY